MVTSRTDDSFPSNPEANPGGALTQDDLSQFQSDFLANPSSHLMQNVVTQRDVNEVALDRTIVMEANHSFSTILDDWTVTNQARSGRCWMFAGLNLFRAKTKNILNLKQFEFSQNWAMFWDKFERANWFLQHIIETSDRDIDDRTVAFR